MAFEIPDLLKLNDRTIRKPKIEIYDDYSSDFTITRATFSLKKKRNGQEVLSGDSDVGPGEVTVNNADLDRAGNTIKTIRPTIDLNDTDLEKGSYMLSFKIFLSTGESDVIRWPVRVVDYEEAA